MPRRKRQQAPGALEHVRAFVNSIDLEGGAEQLVDPTALVRWLAARDLIDAGASASRADLRRALELREALRAFLLANNGAAPDPEAAGVLQAAARRAGLGVRFAPSGSEIAPAKAGVDGAVGRLLAMVHAAMQDSSWERLKACPWDTCHWAFYDHTKNHSGVWCT